MSKYRHVFQVAYGSVYFLLYLVLLSLLFITPTDIIERSIRHRQNYNVWLLVIFYVVTIVVVAFIYFVRLYVNRTELAGIPKAWIPIEVGDVNKAVYKMIAAGLDRSAAISYEARPREDGGIMTPAAAEGLGISKGLQSSIWSEIEHYGWASPNSPDLPNLQYSTVLSELPNLIEAKALTLAPSDPTAQSESPALDPEAAALLQRPANLGLRGYIEYLVTLGVLNYSETVSAFLKLYEYSRFSTRPLSNAQFRELMHLFAEVLRAMEPLDPAALDDEADTPSVSDYDGGISSTPRSHLTRTPTMSTSSSVRRPLRSSSWHQQRRAPSTRSALSGKMSSSDMSVRYARSISSSLSLQSNDLGSVIRLATRDDDEEVPYVLNLRGTAESSSPG